MKDFSLIRCTTERKTALSLNADTLHNSQKKLVQSGKFVFNVKQQQQYTQNDDCSQ